MAAMAINILRKLSVDSEFYKYKKMHFIVDGLTDIEIPYMSLLWDAQTSIQCWKHLMKTVIRLITLSLIIYL